MLNILFVKKTSLPVFVTVLLLSVLGLTKRASAQVVTNLDLTTWDILGDVEVVNSGLANISTNALLDDDFDLGLPDDDFNFSGNPARPVEGFGDSPFLDDFLGVDSSVLDGNTFAVEGAAIKTSLEVNSGDTLSFDWNFLTNETSPETLGPLDDFSFVLVNENLTTLANISDTTLPSNPFDSETDFNNFTFTFPQAGTYDLAFGVIDREDFVITSALNISNVTLTSSSAPTPVPEPNTVLGLLTLPSLLIFVKFLNLRKRLWYI